MVTITHEAERLQVTETIHDHWQLYLAEGILLIILGAAAILIPPVATLAVELVFGWLFLVSGIVGLVTTLRMSRSPGFGWSLVSALMALVAGALLLLWPLNGIVTLTLVLIAFFIVEGIASIMFAVDHRRDLPSGWMWMLVSGVVDLVLAAMVFNGLPNSAAWALGLLVGINMVFGGTALAMMAIQARNLATPPERREAMMSPRAEM